MKTLNIKVKVKDEIEAYKLVNKVSFKYNIIEAKLGRKKAEDFTKKKPKDFLKNVKH